jgi:hypothetical protein
MSRTYETTKTDLDNYRALTDKVREDLREEFGLVATKYDGAELLTISGDLGVCTECLRNDRADAETDVSIVVYNLIMPVQDDDGVEWTEGETVCDECGEISWNSTMEELDESMRQDAGEARYEEMRDEGW